MASPRFPGNFDQAYQDDQPYQDDQAYAGDQAYQDDQAYAGDQAYQDDQAYAGHQAYQDDQAYAGGQAHTGRQAHAGRQAYARDQADEFDEPERSNGTGGVIVAIAATIAGVLVITGILWLIFGGRQQGAAINPNPPGGAAPPPPAADTQLTADAHRYLAIANPANQQLDNEVTAFTASERDNLAAARANLRAEVATATRFDQQLAAIKFPAAVEAIARDVIQANQARVRVITRQARTRTLVRMRAFDAQHATADAAVEVQVKRIRQALHLPAPSSS